MELQSKYYTILHLVVFELMENIVHGTDLAKVEKLAQKSERSHNAQNHLDFKVKTKGGSIE